MSSDEEKVPFSVEPSTAGDGEANKVPVEHEEIPAEAEGDELGSVLSPPEKVGIAFQQEILTGQNAMSKKLSFLIEQNESVARHAGHLEDAVTRISNEHKALIAAHSQIEKLSEQRWERTIVEPMVNQLLPALDIVLEMIAKKGSEKNENTRMDTALAAIQNMILEYLENYSIKVYAPRVKQQFNGTVMKAVRMVRTNDKECHNLVESSLQVGCKIRERVVRPASVAVWRFAEPAN